MKKQLIKMSVFFFLFVQYSVFAQQAKIITAAEFDNNWGLAELIEGYPLDKMPEGVSGIYIAVIDEGSSACLIYKLNNSYKVFPEVKSKFTYNWAKRVGAEYQNGLVKISSEMPYSSVVSTGIFKITNNQLVFIKETVIDPSADFLKDAEAALAKGDIKNAAELFSEKRYPPLDYYEKIQKKLLKRAHEIAMQQFKAKEYKKAAETMGYAYDFGEIRYNIADKKIVRIIADYTFFLDKAKMYQKCIEVSQMLISEEQALVGVYLHLGDSYYHTSQKQKALKAYRTYVDLRKKQGEENRIPTYVKERIANLEANKQ